MWYLARFGGGPSFIVPNVWKQFNKDDGISKTFSYHLPLKFTMSKLKEQWIAIKFCVCFGKTATKTLSMLVVITFFHYKDTQELWKYCTSINKGFRVNFEEFKEWLPPRILPVAATTGSAYSRVITRVISRVIMIPENATHNTFAKLTWLF
jgi:hypothetical protein